MHHSPTLYVEILFSATTSRTHTGWRVVTLVQGGIAADYNQMIKHVLKFNIVTSLAILSLFLYEFLMFKLFLQDDSPSLSPPCRRRYLRPVGKPPLGPSEKSKLLIKFLPENKDKDISILHVATEVLVTPGTRAPVAMASDKFCPNVQISVPQVLIYEMSV